MISLQKVTQKYPNQAPVLNQVDLHVPRGEFIYVLGGTGAGKSTLLKLMAAIDRPAQGSIGLFGYDLARVSPATLRMIRKKIGYVSQDVRLVSDLTLLDNMMLSIELAGLPKKAGYLHQVGELLEAVGLQAKKDRRIAELSGGELQRAAVARALVRRPDILIADEPTGSQDREAGWKLMQLLVQANQVFQTTVIVATHDREVVSRVRKPCAILKGGHVQWSS